MRYHVLAPLILASLSFPVSAQQQPQQAPQPRLPPAQEAVGLAYRQLGLGLDQMQVEGHGREEALQKRIQEIDAYLKACGDKPGCTVPTEGK